MMPTIEAKDCFKKIPKKTEEEIQRIMGAIPERMKELYDIKVEHCYHIRPDGELTDNDVPKGNVYLNIRRKYQPDFNFHVFIKNPGHIYILKQTDLDRKLEFETCAINSDYGIMFLSYEKREGEEESLLHLIKIRRRKG